MSCRTPPPTVTATKGGRDERFARRAVTATRAGHEPNWNPIVRAKSGQANTVADGLCPTRKLGSAPCTSTETVAVHGWLRQFCETDTLKLTGEDTEEGGGICELCTEMR